MAYFQTGLPLGLILWLAFWPLRGAARWAHVALVAGCVAAAGLFGQWLWPSAYAPYVLMGLVVLVAVVGRRRAVDRRGGSVWPGVMAAGAGVIAWAGVALGIDGRLRPGDLVALTLPLNGAALVTEGGSRPVINAHLAVMDPDTPSLSGWRGQAYAVDLVPVDGWGRERNGTGEVRAPCAGAVVGQSTDQRAGRYVMLDCAGVWVGVSGLETVSAQGTLAAGDLLGEGVRVVIHAQSPGTPQHPFSGDPQWIALDGVFPVRGMVLRREN
jgi:hypothetical protein